MTPNQTLAGGAGVPAELVERMVALVRGMAIRSTPASREIDAAENKEACAIAALLPEPVDPDLVLARQIAAWSWRETHIHNGYGYGRDAYLIAGEFDNSNDVRAAYAAIKHMREQSR